MATEDWIQESLARLESLEEERSRHEAALETADDAAALRMHAQAVERLDAKIRALYAELEAAAEQGDGTDAGSSGDDRADVDSDDVDEDDDLEDRGQQGANVEVETRLFRREDVAAQAAAVMQAAPVQAAPISSGPAAAPFGGSAPAAPFGGSSPVAAPFGGSAPAAPFGGSAPAGSPFGGSAPASSPFGGSAPASTSFSSSSGAGFSAAPASSFSGSGGNLDDDDGRRKGAPWGLIIALIVVIGGAGGYFALRPKDAPPPEVPAGPIKVIKAGGVPENTQGPKVVKGADVDSVTGTQFKEGRPQSGGGGGGGGGSSTATPTDKPKKKDPRTKIESTDDPLAGIDK
jgi:uncharacterized coiled-coil protein SlyX